MSATTVNIAWEPPVPVGTDAPILSYKVDCATEPEFINFVNAWDNYDVGDRLNTTVDSLSPETSYWIRVKGHTAIGDTEYSNVLQVTTSAAVIDGIRALYVYSDTGLDPATRIASSLDVRTDAFVDVTGVPPEVYPAGWLTMAGAQYAAVHGDYGFVGQFEGPNIVSVNLATREYVGVCALSPERKSWTPLTFSVDGTVALAVYGSGEPGGHGVWYYDPAGVWNIEVFSHEAGVLTHTGSLSLGDNNYKRPYWDRLHGIDFAANGTAYVSSSTGIQVLQPPYTAIDSVIPVPAMGAPDTISETPVCLTLAENDQTLVVHCSRNNQFRIIHLATLTQERILFPAAPGAGNALATSADGNTVIFWSNGAAKWRMESPLTGATVLEPTDSGTSYNRIYPMPDNSGFVFRGSPGNAFFNAPYTLGGGVIESLPGMPSDGIVIVGRGTYVAPEIGTLAMRFA